MKNRTLLLSLSLLLAVLFSQHAAGQGVFRSYGVQEGLRSRRVYQVERDSSGFLWVYTQEGIDRFDGSEFRPYRLGASVLSRDQVQSATRLFKDAEGRVCVLLRSGKVFRYDRRMDRFDLVMDVSDSIPGETVLNAALPLPDGRFLAATSDGLYLYGKQGFERLGLEGTLLQGITRSAEGILYLAGWDGVYRTEADSSSPRRIGEIPDARYIQVLESGERLFLGTFSDGIMTYDPASATCRPVDGIPSVPVRVLKCLPDGSVLAGLDGAGVYRIDPERLTADPFLSAGEKRLTDNTVSDLCLDGDGTVWVATTTGGLNRFFPEEPTVSWWREEGRNNHVNVIYQDHDGDFWYGTNSGVFLLRQDGTKERFLRRNVVLSVAQDASGTVYVGGFGMGLHRIDKPTGRCQVIAGSPLQYIYYIYPDGHRLWIGGLEGDFCRMDTRNGEWVRYPFSCVGDIWEDGADSLYLAGCQGLGHFDKKTGDIRWIRDFGSFSLRYPVRAIFRSSDRTLWLATDGDGLVRYDPSTGEADRFTTENGLLSDSVISVHEDRDGRVWFTTEEGIFWLDPSRRTIIDAGPLLDLEGGIFNQNAVWLHPDGKLSFGTSEGVLTFDPARMDYFKPLDVRLVLTDLRVDYETVEPGGKLLPSCLDETPSLTLDARSNTFSVAFSAVNFGSDFRIRYEYRLDGWESRWTRTSVPGMAGYVNVAPGHYVLELRAVDKYSGEEQVVRRLPIRILPPWYLTPLAFGIYGILALLAAAWTFRWLRRRKYEERVRDKMRTFVSVAHDLKTPVSLIKGPLGSLENTPDLSEESRESVMLATRNADRLMEMISRLLDLRDEDGGEDGRPVLQMTDLGELLSAQMEVYRPAAVQRGIDFSLDVSESMRRVPTDRKKMTSIVGNLVSNSLKYTEKGAVDVLVHPEGRHRWMLEVRDTGIGIPLREQRNLFSDSFRASNVGDVDGTGIGLMITREMVRSLGGRIAFRSEEGKGTCFRITFPLRYRHGSPLDGEQEDGVPAVPAPATSVQNRATLLVVDDEPDMLSYLQGLLSDEYDVLTAPDGAAALEIVRSANPDIVITDMVMPVLSGEELCRILKSSVETSHIPVILLTAVSARESIVFGLEAGAIDYVLKPFDPQVLKARIRSILGERERLRIWLQATDGKDAPDRPDWGSRLDREFMEKVLSVLEREVANPDFSIADLCREAAMSRTAFFNKLKSLTGQGPNDYIRTFRLNKARELLQEHRLTIQQVSDAVGFADPKYFSSCYKKQFGVSPSKV